MRNIWLKLQSTNIDLGVLNPTWNSPLKAKLILPLTFKRMTLIKIPLEYIRAYLQKLHNFFFFLVVVKSNFNDNIITWIKKTLTIIFNIFSTLAYSSPPALGILHFTWVWFFLYNYRSWLPWLRSSFLSYSEWLQLHSKNISESLSNVDPSFWSMPFTL